MLWYYGIFLENVSLRNRQRVQVFVVLTENSRIVSERDRRPYFGVNPTVRKD
jgi:hypothetical protein